MSLSGLKDIDREVLKHMDDKDLLKICSVNRKTWNEVCDDNFLRRRLMKYPEIEKYKKENESWKEFFLRVLYYVSKMQEEFEFKYTEGDFKNQYILLKKSAKKRYTKDELLNKASEGELSIVKYSLERGADIHNNQDSALRIAAANGKLNIVIFLVNSGANIHANHESALLNASVYGHLDVVKFLISSGADLDSNYDTILSWTEGLGHEEVAKYLKSLKSLKNEL